MFSFSILLFDDFFFFCTLFVYIQSLASCINFGIKFYIHYTIECKSSWRCGVVDIRKWRHELVFGNECMFQGRWKFYLLTYFHEEESVPVMWISFHSLNLDINFENTPKKLYFAWTIQCFLNYWKNFKESVVDLVPIKNQSTVKEIFSGENKRKIFSSNSSGWSSSFVYHAKIVITRESQ